MFKDIYLEHLPNEVPDDVVCEAFRPFGAIHEIVHLKYVGSPIYTGTRLLKVALASDVPVNLRVMRYPCRVFYKGQPRPCAIGRSSDHRASDCPLRDVCRAFREPGHFARDCPGVVPAPPPSETVEEDVPTDDVDDVPVPSLIEIVDDINDDDDADYAPSADDIEVDDDLDVEDDVFGSGDDEVLQSTQVLPPGSSRLSPDVSASADRFVPAPSVCEPDGWMLLISFVLIVPCGSREPLR